MKQSILRVLSSQRTYMLAAMVVVIAMYLALEYDLRHYRSIRDRMAEANERANNVLPSEKNRRIQARIDELNKRIGNIGLASSADFEARKNIGKVIRVQLVSKALDTTKYGIPIYSFYVRDPATEKESHIEVDAATFYSSRIGSSVRARIANMDRDLQWSPE